MGQDIRHYPGKVRVEIRCPGNPGHHRRYVVADLSLRADGWAEWLDSCGKRQVGFMGQGSCCGMPIVSDGG